MDITNLSREERNRFVHQTLAPVKTREQIVKTILEDIQDLFECDETESKNILNNLCGEFIKSRNEKALKDFVKSNPFLNGEYLVESENSVTS
jgi:hypothetical protein